MFTWQLCLCLEFRFPARWHFNSLGKAISSIVVAVMRKFVLLIPLIYIMPHIFTTDQTMAVYMAEPVADFIAVTFTAILFSVQFKKALAAIRLN